MSCRPVLVGFSNPSVTMPQAATEDDEWNSLNLEARANLRPGDLEAFFRYRDQLRREERPWLNDARDSLAGWIWDTIEGYEE